MRALSHLRCRRNIGHFADGELGAASQQALAAHLLECDGCRRELDMVRAIKASLGRLAEAEPPALAATRLRRWSASLPRIGELRSPQLSDRTRVAAEPARGTAGRARTPVEWTIHRRFRALIGAGAVLAVTAAGLLLHRPGPSPGPGPMVALLELASLDSARPGGPEQRDGHTLELADQRVSLLRRIVDGRPVLIAISDRAFVMPADARPVSGERHAPLLARRGDMSIACLSRPAHMLVVGPLAAERLIDIAREVEPLARTFSG